MCLKTNNAAKEVFLAVAPETLTAYKVMLIVEGKLTGPFWKGTAYVPGEQSSSRLALSEIQLEDELTYEQTYERIDHGYHVCLTRAEAERLITKMVNDDRCFVNFHPVTGEPVPNTKPVPTRAIVEVQVKKADLVAVGQWSDWHQKGKTEQAVFTKLTITEEEYDKHVSSHE